MRRGVPSTVLGVILGLWAAPAAGAEHGPGALAGPRPLEAILEEFRAGAPPPEASVRLDAWVEATGGGREVVVVLEPEGRTRLVADPGIAVTPAAQPGVTWQIPLPHRLVDPGRDYFAPPTAVRLPFTATGDAPIEILVEYAYCIVDQQCFFGEETLTVSNVVN